MPHRPKTFYPKRIERTHHISNHLSVRLRRRMERTAMVTQIERNHIKHGPQRGCVQAPLIATPIQPMQQHERRTQRIGRTPPSTRQQPLPQRGSRKMLMLGDQIVSPS